MTKPTQRQQVLAHLTGMGTITPMVALAEFGIIRLGAVIHSLRSEGYPIHTQVRVSLQGRKFAEYRLGSVGHTHVSHIDLSPVPVERRYNSIGMR